MNDDSRPAFDPTPSIDVETASTTPTGSVPQARQSRTAALRTGGLLGTALVVLVGSAVVLGASPSAPGTGADPSGSGPAAQASGAPEKPRADRKIGRGLGPLRGFFGGRGDGGPAGIGGVFGKITVKSISGSSVSLATDDGWTRTITVTADTKITKGGEDAKLADLAVGDVIRLREKRNDDGTWTITGIAIVLPRTGGAVTAVGSDTFTVTVRGGTSETIHTTSKTTYRLEGKDATRGDVKVGSIIGAVGERSSDGTFTATAITIAVPMVAGTVDSVGADSLTITKRDGTKVTVHVGSSTKIRVAGVENATLKDVKAGMRILVRGLQRSDGSIDADGLGAGQPGKARNSAPKPAASAPSGGNG
jgi:hypothetical protein